MKLADKIAMKINDIDDIIEMVGKFYVQTRNEKDLDFALRRIAARNILESYLENLI